MSALHGALSGANSSNRRQQRYGVHEGRTVNCLVKDRQFIPDSKPVPKQAHRLTDPAKIDRQKDIYFDRSCWIVRYIVHRAAM